MFEILTVFSTFDLLSFNNSLHFNLCGITNDASYIYLDSHDLLFGVVENSNITHFNYTLFEKCNQSLSWIPNEVFKNIFTTGDNMVVTRVPQSTVTVLQTNDSEIQNLTYGDVTTDNKCSLQHYYFMFVAVVTFLIGLVVQPDRIYEFLKKYVREQLYAGIMIFQESESSFRIPI